MHPFSISFETSDHPLVKVLSIILALFTAGVWLYFSSNPKNVIKVTLSLLAGFVSYFIALFFFSVVEFSFVNIIDNFSANKRTAVIVDYQKKESISRSKDSKSIITHTYKNVFYTPIIEYKNKNQKIKKTLGDISFSEENQLPIGSTISVIEEANKVRQISPIKTFATLVNVLVISFLFLFYYIIYSYGKNESLDGIENILVYIFTIVIFPMAFFILMYLFLNIGYENLILNKKTTSKGTAIFVTGLGVFIGLCFIGYIRIFFENANKKKNKKRTKMQKNKMKKN